MKKKVQIHRILIPLREGENKKRNPQTGKKNKMLKMLDSETDNESADDNLDLEL